MEIVIAAVLVIVAVATFVVLARGPHPDDAEHSTPDGSGPTGEHYPPGSRPAGPGAEAQNPNHPGAPSPDPDA